MLNNVWLILATIYNTANRYPHWCKEKVQLWGKGLFFPLYKNNSVFLYKSLTNLKYLGGIKKLVSQEDIINRKHDQHSLIFHWCFFYLNPRISALFHTACLVSCRHFLQWAQHKVTAPDGNARFHSPRGSVDINAAARRGSPRSQEPDINTLFLGKLGVK